MTKDVAIHQIDQRILFNHVAVLGKTGSGKTYCAKGIVENLLTTGQRVCIIDPTSAWWGLRSDATGDGPGFRITIFGGSHADIPIERHHGAAIAEIIGGSDISAIIDTQLMTVAERTEFFADFAEAMFRRNVGVLHLVIDECHLFMPQGKVIDPQSGRMLHAGNNLVSLGRSRGFRIMLISQRASKVHKDSLTQAEAIIAMRLIAPQDRDAVRDWIVECAQKEQGRELMESLASLPTGTGWIWAPALDLLQRVKFPPIHTYDSSSTPFGAKSGIVLARVDLPEIETKLAAVSKEIVDNSPKNLKQRVKELEAQLAARGDSAELATLRKQVDDEQSERARVVDAFKMTLANLKRQFEELAQEIGQEIEHNARESWSQFGPGPIVDHVEETRPKPLQKVHSNGRVTGTNSQPHSKPAQSEKLAGPDQKILAALAELHALGINEPARIFIAMLSGYGHVNSTGFAKAVSRLSTAGHVRYPSGGSIAITPDGMRVAPHVSKPGTVRELQQRVIQMLPGSNARPLTELLKVYPRPMERLALARACGYTHVNSTGYAKAISRLSSLKLVEYPDKGHVRASDLMFLK